MSGSKEQSRWAVPAMPSPKMYSNKSTSSGQPMATSKHATTQGGGYSSVFNLKNPGSK